jgi:hypothetical protein
VNLNQFFEKYVRKRGVTMADKLAKEIKSISSEPYPPASRPGRPPHRRSGRFVSGVHVIRTVNGALVRFYAAHSKFLIYGTKNMKARPALQIAAKKLGIKLK